MNEEPVHAPKQSKFKKISIKKPSSSKNLLVVGLIVILVAAIASAIFFYNQYQDVKNNPRDAIAAKNTQETSEVLTALKEVIFIDTDEAPTVARVENPETLKQNNATFYKNVAQGDYLIIFKDRAIIFRASNNQVINVAPIINTAELEAKRAEQAKQEAENNNTNNRRNNTNN